MKKSTKSLIRQLINGNVSEIYNIDESDALKLLNDGFVIKRKIDNEDGTISVIISNDEINFIYFKMTT